jgi:hypothetical protein
MHLYRITFVAGLAVGFVAGTRAGRERYDQMVKLAKTTAENPTVQQAAGAIHAQATGLLSTAAQKVGGQLHDKVPQMAQSAVHSVGDRIPGLKHKNGQRGAANNGETGASDGHPFAGTSNSHLGPTGS